MKKSTTHSSLLGFTQSQMALLLKVHTSQWSMYESGKRDIPSKAKQVLASMFGFLKLEEKSHKVHQHIAEQEELKKNCLEKLLKKNEFNLHLIDKKISSIERKYNNNFQIIGLVDYLNTSAIKELMDENYLQVLTSNAESALKKSGLAELTVLQIKKQLLEQERELLISYINKIA